MLALPFSQSCSEDHGGVGCVWMWGEHLSGSLSPQLCSQSGNTKDKLLGGNKGMRGYSGNLGFNPKSLIYNNSD